MRSKLFSAILGFLFGGLAFAHPMVSPEIDEKTPFSYYSRPTDQLGVMDAPKGFMVTAEGYLYNRALELMFLYGPSLDLVQNRNRTLNEGVYPVINYQLEKAGVRYSWQMFAFTLERGKPRSPLYALVKVTMENRESEPRTAYLASGIRHRGLTPRIEVSRDYHFQRESVYEVRGDVILRNEEAVALLPRSESRRLHSTIDRPYNGSFHGSAFAVTETTPVCLSEYALPLKPGQSQSLYFAMPNVPTNWVALAEFVKDGDLESLYEEKLQELKEDWDAFFARGIDLKIPEEKVQQTYLASLVNIAISRDDEGNGYYSQGVNEMQYTGFFPRDSMYFSWSWYFAGYQEEGQKVADYYEKQQHKDGRFFNDQENIAPFSILKWYRRTKNREYAERMWPRIYKNFHCVTNQIENDPLKLMPAMGPYDNEGITGHYTAHNFYNAKAFDYMADLALELGKTNEATGIRSYGKKFTANMMKHLDAAIATNGFIPPGLDTGKSGAHWGNMEASYPTFVLGSRDERVKKTIDYIRDVDWSEEKLIMFNALGCNSLHHYNTLKASMADLYLGRDRNVIEDLYGVLLHTSSTHGFFEFCLDPWSNRDFGGNFSPHGWGHVKYIALLRNMFVREDECSNLFLLSALAPSWTLPGKEIVARRLPTTFGTVDLVVHGTREGLLVDLGLDQNGGVWGLPREIFMKVPYFAQRASVFVDDKNVAVDELGFFPVPLNAKKVEMKFKRSDEPLITYKSTVRWYISEYAKRFNAWRRSNPFTELWQCFPEKKLEDFSERQKRDQQLKQEEGLMTFIPVFASSESKNHDAKYINDGISTDRTPKFWKPLPEDKEPWFECSFDETIIAWCIKLIGDDIEKAAAKVYVTTESGENILVGESNQAKLPVRGKHFVCTFKQQPIKKVRVEFKGPVGRIFECTLLSQKDCWHTGIPRVSPKTGDLAYGCPVFTTQSENPTEPDLVDGETDCAVSLWSGAPPHPQWAIIDLGEPMTFSKIRTYFFHDGRRCYSYRYLVSDDLQEWREIGGKDEQIALKEGDEITFEPTTARYVMIRIDKNTDNPAGHVAEVEIY